MKESINIPADFWGDLKEPEVFLSHVQEQTEKITAKQNLFPVDVFPEAIRQIIKATNETLLFPTDFTGASILYAISVAIGNTHAVEVKKGWNETAVLYLSIVGRAGTNKSHPISYALKPIEKKDSEKFKEYVKKAQEFEAVKNLSKKERQEQGYDDPVKPIWEQHLVSDFTPEALTDIHKFNTRGIGVYVDELASWFKNFNRYNKGSEEQFWLSVWSGKSIRINRKTTEPTYLELPFISVIGTIQPGVLDELATNRTENGFLDRILFIIPDQLKKEYWNDAELPAAIGDNWNAIIKRILELQLPQDEFGNLQPQLLRFSQDAKKIIADFQKDLTDRSNNESEETAGIYAKIEMYAIRLSLILEMAFFACNEGNRAEISARAAAGAVKLCEYFILTANKVHSIVKANPFEKLPKDKQAIYIALPESFATGEGVQIAAQMGMPERTFKMFLNEKELFSKVSHGVYEKKF